MTRAILLAAGFGTRLKPLTDTIPKCLVPIGDRPLLELWLTKLSDLGVSEILVNTHYLHSQVEDFVSASRFAPMVRLVFEPKLLGTARTIWKNRDFIGDETTLVIHADNYSEDSLRDLLAAHSSRPSQCLISMLAFRTEHPQTCGILDVDQNGVMIKFIEKPKQSNSNLANAAIYCISPEFVNTLEGKNDLSTEVLPNLINQVLVHETKDVLIDIGELDSYERAQSARWMSIRNSTI